MTAERWAQVKELFGAAIEKSAAERAAFLAAACVEDSDLRREVERLVAQADGSLRSPAAELLARAPELSAGETLSQYRIQAKLGEGGMGAVYRAFDTRLERTVALKVLPRGSADGDARLMREARAASALNHPNIVTVHEIASDHGTDFISME